MNESGGDEEVVLHARHTGGGPGCVLSLAAIRERSDVSPQGQFVAIDIDVDGLGAELGIALDRLLDRGLDDRDR